MAIFRCKMCGGELEVTAEDSIMECSSCGRRQTLPKLDSDKKINLYDRANHFRRNNDYDKAMGIYEQILNEDSSDAESYWSIVLCRYGIEYVEDPVTKKRVPTINRTQRTSVFADEDYKSALKYANGLQKPIYEEEAEVIDRIQKGILEISEKEEPFDIFICYKETDASGRRTQDSVLANELYYALTEEGYHVFFSRITLEDKIGQEFEPYIFSALNSAKIMIVIGTRPEYFSAPWVKNEWSRFLGQVKKDTKKVLIPAYKDMDPYDLPEEFSHLQAQDMSKLGFVQDLLRGIRKLFPKEEKKDLSGNRGENIIIQSGGNVNVEALLKRGYMALEDREWENAREFFEQVLNIDAECAQAYFGKFLCEKKVDGFETYRAQWIKNIYFEPVRYSVPTALDKKAGEIISGSSVSLEEQRKYIISELDKINMDYFSDKIKWLKQKKELEAELNNDKNIERAKKFDRDGGAGIEEQISQLFDEIEKKIKEASEKEEKEKIKLSEKFEEESRKIASKAEIRQIFAEESVSESLFADKKETAEKYLSEKKKIEYLYEQTDMKSPGDFSKAVDTLSWDVFDIEAEKSRWRDAEEIAGRIKNHNIELSNLEKQKGVLQKKYTEEKKKKEGLEQAASDYTKRANEREDSRIGTAIELIILAVLFLATGFLWGISMWIFLIGGALVFFADHGAGVVLCAIGGVFYWFELAENNVARGIVFAIGGILLLIGIVNIIKNSTESKEQKAKEYRYALEKHAVDQEMKSSENELADLEKNIKGNKEAVLEEKKSLKKPTPLLRMQSEHFLHYLWYEPAKYQKLQDMYVVFEVDGYRKLVPGIKNLILYRYETGTFYPVEEVKQEDPEKNTVRLELKGFGLSVKLEKFQPEEHFILFCKA